MKRVILAVAIAAACATSAFAAGSERTIAGAAQVVDGDSLVVRGVRIRILDVDAPESGQFCFAKSETIDQGAWHCGRQAARALSDQIGDQKVSCDMTGQGIRKSWLARCSVGVPGPGAMARGQRVGGAGAGLQMRSRPLGVGSRQGGGARHLVQRLHHAVGLAQGALAAPSAPSARVSYSGGDREIARPQSGRSRGRRCCTASPAAAPAGVSHRAR